MSDHPCENQPHESVDDMIHLSNLTMDGLNQNLKQRYSRDQIYTSIGSILISVNPYKDLPIYGPESMTKCRNTPHIYSLAQSVYSNFSSSLMNQSIVISGESGSGKTESARFLLQYLCNKSVSNNEKTASSNRLEQVMQAGIILESFGNAKTVTNDNSSRFGKLIKLCFDRNEITGCMIQDYLLEQSRITSVSPGERNYHVFYGLIAEPENTVKYDLGESPKFKYLGVGCETNARANDATDFRKLIAAMSSLQIGQATTNSIFSTLSAILWLGNIDFEADSESDSVRLTKDDKQILGKISNLTGVETAKLKQILLRRQINVCGNITDIPLKLHEASDNRHAMAKFLYSKVFAWLIDHINRMMAPDQKEDETFIGILDIFGFEDFAVNSFDQLCINYANEKLQQFFHHYVIVLEREMYRHEGINLDLDMETSDNSLCLELMEKPPKSILRMLTEEIRIPKGSDATFLTKIHQEFKDHPHYVKGNDRRTWDMEFGINHYAGTVTYTVAGFLDKNRDNRQDELIELMSNSSSSLVKDLARVHESQQQFNYGTITSTMSTMSTGSKSTTTMSTRSSVTDTFRQQLTSLIDMSTLR